MLSWLKDRYQTLLWNRVGLPCLGYGMKCVNLTKRNVASLETAQASTIKRVLGISKRSHHSALLKALQVPKVHENIISDTVSFARRAFEIDSAYKNLCLEFLSRYIISGLAPKGSLVDRLCSYGISPTRVALGLPIVRNTPEPSDGVSDSLRYLLHSDNYNNRSSPEYKLASLLVKAF